MTRLLSKKQICMEGGYMQDRIKNINWGMIIMLTVGVIFWYFLITHPITTILTIVGGSITIGLLLKYTDERDL